MYHKNAFLLCHFVVQKLFRFHQRQTATVRIELWAFILYRVYREEAELHTSELTKELALDWGHSQRCITRLVSDGFITKEKAGRHYLLNLTERGQKAFDAAHQVFFDWDNTFMTNLTAKEKERLLALLEKATERIPHHVRND